MPAFVICRGQPVCRFVLRSENDLIHPKGGRPSVLIGVPKETFPGERRVALVPATVAPLKKAKLEVVIEAGAGAPAGFPDSAYQHAGATLCESRSKLFADADVILQVRGLG